MCACFRGLDYLCGMKKRIAFHTLGCKLNFAETSTLARQLEAGGYELVDFRDEADIYVINTCYVTGTAEKKCRLAIHQAHRRNPGARIAVLGCFASLDPAGIAAMDGVDIILGSNDKFRLPEILQADKAPVTEGTSTANRDFIPAWSSHGRTRAFVKIQDGCDYFCSYCSIPFARGRSRSSGVAEVKDTIRQALSAGVKEIILTGVNTGDFGRHQGESFSELLRELDKMDDLRRLRLSSVEPDLLHDEIIALVASSGKLMPHFHIPLQSGSDRILKLMKRNYDAQLFRDLVLNIRERLPFAFIAADVIAGFPGETDADFMESLDLLRDLPLSFIHAFPYSARPGTASLRLPGQLPGSVITERNRELNLLAGQKKESFYKLNTGRTDRVLFESGKKSGWMQGFTENYLLVRTAFREELVNRIVAVKLEQLGSAPLAFNMPES